MATQEPGALCQYTFADPFAGSITAWGYSIEDAIEGAYQDIQAEERPAWVHYEGRPVTVPGGMARPL